MPNNENNAISGRGIKQPEKNMRMKKGKQLRVRSPNIFLTKQDVIILIPMVAKHTAAVIGNARKIELPGL